MIRPYLQVYLKQERDRLLCSLSIKNMNTTETLENTIITWKGWGYPRRHNNAWQSQCQFQVKPRIENPDNVACLFIELPGKDNGTSITNCCENVIPLVQNQFIELLRGKTVQWFEYYPESSENDYVSEIVLQNGKPTWKPRSKTAFEVTFGKIELGNVPRVPVNLQ